MPPTKIKYTKMGKLIYHHYPNWYIDKPESYPLLKI